jgi:hypothetical protein
MIQINKLSKGNVTVDEGCVDGSLRQGTDIKFSKGTRNADGREGINDQGSLRAQNIAVY